ncbi:FliI/YscN family ATPase [Cupriavidus sp. SW-Y-13]|uniref:FliI/YscN family ATPase n=1 Tax=Cupriavidus sp. SW-Y-13 TaxID=2653854 RepID=UPI0013655379|nr:FliI/YscN family ATPase [Cupriavidus sp. SW-Y-13]MWL90523.1 FliI/YscN family ATPase [Cupriavidus sp. SW-Y-13]
MTAILSAVRAATATVILTERTGTVRRLSGLAIEAEGPDAVIGEVCAISTRHGDATVMAEIVGVRPGAVTLMPYTAVQGLGAGSRVVATGRMASIPVGDALLGRVIDGFGEALDGGLRPACTERRALHAKPLNPMQRPRIEHVLETGVRSIDTLLTLGNGQRVGIFAGSGVGKSTLLGMIARHVKADINVIALIGERGREVREFIDNQLGPEGMQRSVVVVATSDQPALARVHAAYAAVAIAESFRDAGKQVLLTMDSVTRLAMARREIGLSAGEPPTARGYTPSVFAELPQLCERCGTAPGGGSITALMTVLVEGDDMNEPIADTLRATLDGHIVLSRALAHQGQYPAIDVLQSASRLMSDLVDRPTRKVATEAVRNLAVLERNRQLVDIGAYEAGSNPELDAALTRAAGLRGFLTQADGGADRAGAVETLRDIVAGAPAQVLDMQPMRGATRHAQREPIHG